MRRPLLQLNAYNSGKRAGFDGGCDVRMDSLDCDLNGLQIAGGSEHAAATAVAGAGASAGCAPCSRGLQRVVGSRGVQRLGSLTLQASHMLPAVLSMLIVTLFLFTWALFGRRALRDHRLLPHCRYKESHIFVRVQLRCVGPVQVGRRAGLGS